MGYPTDPVGRSRHLDARSPSNTVSGSEGIFTPTSQVQSPNLYTNEQIHNGLCALPEDDMMMDASEIWARGVRSPADPEAYMSFKPHVNEGHVNDIHHTTSSHGVQTNPELEVAPWPSTDNNFGISTTSFESTFDFDNAAMELGGGEYFGIDTGSHVAMSGNNDGFLHPKNTEIAWNTESPFGSGYQNGFHSSGMDLDQDMPSFREDLTQPQPRRSGSFRNGSIDIKLPFQNFMASSNTAGTRNKIRSLFRTKSGSSIRSGSSAKKYATSQYTNNTHDSGYGSGFGSCLTLDDVRKINSQSLREFNGLYRVACQHLHEPRGKAELRDIQTCSHCRYSSIHNLGWSARYLKLEVFLSELKLEGVYDFNGVDAAGNTSLHYAAAGGASFRYLKALIDNGADPYAANTAGELFIYCLRPLQPFTLEPNSDCLKSDDDLINLLNLLDLQRVQNWRDNDGQSILHALYSKISDPDLRTRVFEWVTPFAVYKFPYVREANTYHRIFLNAGYCSSVRDRFGRTAEDVVPLIYDCHGQVIETDHRHSSQSSNENFVETRAGMTCEDMLAAELRSQQVKQIKAQDIVLQARHQPTYVDPSNDNILHALSRLKAGNDTLLSLGFNANDSNFQRQGNLILLSLEYFIPRGVDLNLHNLDGCFPLKAFVCERPWEDAETGATLSRYIDAILWKDSKARVPNNINVNLKDREGATALHAAASRGKPDSVRSLIEAGGNVNARSGELFLWFWVVQFVNDV